MKTARCIDINSVICTGCRMPASLNQDGLCEFCGSSYRRAADWVKSIDTRSIARSSHRRHYAILFGIGFIAIAVFIFGLVMAAEVGR